MRHWLNGYENTHGYYQRRPSTQYERYYFTESGYNSEGRTGTVTNTTELKEIYAQSVWGKLPLVLRAMIATVNVIASIGNQSSTMKTSADKLFLFSSRELFGQTSPASIANEVDLNGNSNYYSLPFFVNNNTFGYRIKNMPGSTSGDWWWCRSSEPANSTLFRYVNFNGTSNNYGAGFSGGVVFGFCIGIPQSS